jgi:hypothetical protein
MHWCENFESVQSHALYEERRPHINDKKKKKFSSYTYKEIQMGSGAKSYIMRTGFLTCEEMRKYLIIY